MGKTIVDVKNLLRYQFIDALTERLSTLGIEVEAVLEQGQVGSLDDVEVAVVSGQAVQGIGHDGRTLPTVL